MFTETLWSLSEEPEKGSGWIYTSCCARPLLVTFQPCSGQSTGHAGTHFANHTVWDCRLLTSAHPWPSALSASGSWHCSDSCSSFRFKQSKFTGGLYLPLTPSYAITLMFLFRLFIYLFILNETSDWGFKSNWAGSSFWSFITILNFMENSQSLRHTSI